jgi:hypothetical protein
MNKTDYIFDNAGTLLAEMHDPALETTEGIQQTVEDYKNLMGCLDAIWSAVRGLDLGLLPTPANLVFLEKAIAEGKRRWLELGLSTLLLELEIVEVNDILATQVSNQDTVIVLLHYP